MVGRIPPTEMFGRQNADKERRDREMADALRIDGSQFVRLYEKMQALIANLTTTVTTLVSSALAGTISPGAVATSGDVSGDHATFPGGVNSVGVYNMLLTYGGPYSSQYVHSDGTMGYVPSSLRFKQDVETAILDPAVLSYLRVVTYRYIAAVENLGDGAAVEVGLIAEEVDELGLTWLVDYDADGKPLGVRYDRLALIFIPWMQNVEERLTALEG